MKVRQIRPPERHHEFAPQNLDRGITAKKDVVGLVADGYGPTNNEAGWIGAIWFVGIIGLRNVSFGGGSAPIVATRALVRCGRIRDWRCP